MSCNASRRAQDSPLSPRAFPNFHNFGIESWHHQYWTILSFFLRRKYREWM